LNPTNGFSVYGALAYDAIGLSVSGGGDVNSDGYKDIIIGAPNARNDQSQASFVIYGSNSTNDIDLVHLRVSADNTGFSVSIADDVNNDGYSDIIIGAKGANQINATPKGVVYILFGSPFVTSAPTLAPTPWPTFLQHPYGEALIDLGVLNRTHDFTIFKGDEGEY
jgi:hypothetical protein